MVSLTASHCLTANICLVPCSSSLLTSVAAVQYLIFGVLHHHKAADRPLTSLLVDEIRPHAWNPTSRFYCCLWRLHPVLNHFKTEQSVGFIGLACLWTQNCGVTHIFPVRHCVYSSALNHYIILYYTIAHPFAFTRNKTLLCRFTDKYLQWWISIFHKQPKPVCSACSRECLVWFWVCRSAQTQSWLIFKLLSSWKTPERENETHSVVKVNISDCF